MRNITVALAQCRSVRGDIGENVSIHAASTIKAISEGADIILFPELSLTGYEPDIASTSTSTLEVNDTRLAPLQQLAREYAISIVAGAPVRSEQDKPNIGALVITPDGAHIHRKNHLHPGEEIYFSAYRDRNRMLKINGVNICLAICADIDNPEHAARAAKAGANIYAAGVLMMDGYADSAERMSDYAHNYSMLTVMANYGLPTGGFIPSGRSAAWDESGNLLAEAPAVGEALVIVSGIPGRWHAATHSYNDNETT